MKKHLRVLVVAAWVSGARMGRRVSDTGRGAGAAACVRPRTERVRDVSDAVRAVHGNPNVDRAPTPTACAR